MGEFRVSGFVDKFGRVHRDLRVSLIDKCNLRCTYCMPNEKMQWLPNQELLTVDELLRVVRIAVEHGIEEVRLTGGEPLLHPRILDIVGGIAALPNAPKLAITTNAVRLAPIAQHLVDAGLQRFNISIDTLDRERFKQLTRRDELDAVLEGIAAAKATGSTPIKVNAVLMRGINDDEAVPLLRHAIEHGWNLRFIEQMPLDAGGLWARPVMVTAAEIFEDLSRVFTLTPVEGRGSAPAEEFLVDGGPATVGIIASVSKPFCAACDRLRLTADGQVRNCLFSEEETDLRATLRDPALSDAERRERIAGLFLASTLAKLPGHGVNDPSFIQPSRPMSAIGG